MRGRRRGERNKLSDQTMSGANDRDADKGLLWKLPEIQTKDFGKIGPAFSFGAGCGFGFGLGVIGGFGIGPGIPGLQLGLGVGAGCGVGLGFGYGVGRGVAYDDRKRYSNIGRPFNGSYVPSHNEVGALVDELVINTKKLMVAASKEMDKWRR
ncbi:uncharacterized protein LOC110739153 [Chenopodium quinoa]|uniref:uncharacterized protein LOC110739153 n=1 Tax=Chenopodium quinoa TaxID=63459 RepID=UPI000B772CF9|nr:uncharacterized protein LOC110739153 [Chenopodium quinoa]